MSQQLLPADLQRHRRAGAHRRRRRRRDRCSLLVREGTGRLDHRGHHPPALGPPPRARGGRRRHRRHDVAGRRDADAITEQTGVPSRAGRTATWSPSATCDARRHPPARPHARLDRAARATTPTARTAPVHRRLALPRRRRQHQRTPPASPRSSTTSSSEGLRPAPRRRHLVLPRPRRRLARSAPSGRTSRSGASAAGENEEINRSCRMSGCYARGGQRALHRSGTAAHPA